MIKFSVKNKNGRREDVKENVYRALAIKRNSVRKVERSRSWRREREGEYYPDIESFANPRRYGGRERRRETKIATS